jgi:hypothetical protein
MAWHAIGGPALDLRDRHAATAAVFVAQLGVDFQDDSCPHEVRRLGRTICAGSTRSPRGIAATTRTDRPKRSLSGAGSGLSSMWLARVLASVGDAFSGGVSDVHDVFVSMGWLSWWGAFTLLA